MATLARSTRIRPPYLLAGAMVLAVLLILWWASDRIFAIDEWDYVTQRDEWTLNNVIRPSNGHLIAVPLLVYKALLSAFGADSHLPFTLLTIVLHLSVVGLFYVLAARRVGSWVALIPTVLLLFFGAGWEVMINTAAMQNQFGIAAGLGALLCLDRRDRRGDVLAALLLAVSLASFTIGLAFAAGALVRLALDRADRRDDRRFAIVVLPVLGYAAWFVWARQYGQSSVSAASVASVASGAFDQLSAILAGISGLFRPVGAEGATPEGIVTERATVLTFALLALLAVRLRRPPRLSPSAWGALTILAAYLTLVAIGLGELRVPEASRYVYMGAILLLLASVELLSRLRLARGWVLAAAAATALSLLANVGQIRAAGDFFELESDLNRAELTALELTRDSVDPALLPEGDAGNDAILQRDLVFLAADYFAMVDRLGSPAYSEEELAAASEEARQAADASFVRNLAIGIEPAAGGGDAAAGTAPPPVVAELNAEAISRGPCLLVEPLSPGSALVVVAVPGGFSFASQVEPLLVGLQRFADQGSAPLPLQGASGTVAIPPDDSSRSWRAAFEVVAPTRICALAGATP